MIPYCKIDHVTKIFTRGTAETRVLKEITFEVEKGEYVSIIGHSGCGKSTLLNLLTGADVVTENKLFATLDPTTRSLVLPNKQRVLLTDTVGFLRKLPHTLIESFKATLEEVSEADLLIHIVDLSHPRVDEQMEAVDGVIKELDAFGKQTLIVFNKIDNLPNRELAESYTKRFPGSVAISARTGEGTNKLVAALENALRPSSITRRTLKLAFSAGSSQHGIARRASVASN